MNIRQKGANGEREVADMLNAIICEVLSDIGYPQEDIDRARKAVQRNQNQSAVGGNDLTNTFGLSIEVKRQEQLSVGTWWKQCVEAAKRNNEVPVLIYRQNRKAWRIRAEAWLYVGPTEGTQGVMEMDLDLFKVWFKQLVRYKIDNGHEVKI